MIKKTKAWLCAAVLLIACGIVLFAVSLGNHNGDITQLGKDQFEINNHEFEDNISGFCVNTSTADIEFIPYDEKNTRIVCFELKKAKHTVEYNETTGTISINVTDERAWYEQVGIFISSPKITVYLPERKYLSIALETHTGDVNIPDELLLGNITVSTTTGNVKCSANTTEKLKISTHTGNIQLSNVTTNELELDVTTGNINVSAVKCNGDISVGVSTGNAYLTDTYCGTLTSNGSTGRMVLTNVIASAKLSIERSTGDVKFEACDADEIYVKTSTGSVTGTLKSQKTFITDTNTGSVNVPSGTTGGTCKIKTSTGSIRISLT